MARWRAVSTPSGRTMQQTIEQSPEADAAWREKGLRSDGRHLGRLALAGHRHGAQLRAGLSLCALDGNVCGGMVHGPDRDVPGLGDATRWESVACSDRPRRHQWDSGAAMLFARGRPNPLLGPVIHCTLVLDEVRGQPGLHHPPLLEHVGPIRGGKRRVGVASDRVR